MYCYHAIAVNIEIKNKSSLFIRETNIMCLNSYKRAIDKSYRFVKSNNFYYDEVDLGYRV